jgi:hypothetical protein
MTDPSFQLKIAVKPYCIFLLLVSLVLVAVHTALYSYNEYIGEVPWLILQLFDLDEENNLPTWWSGFLLLNVAFFVFIVASANRDKTRPYWFAIAAGFLILAIDEVAGLHESLNSAIVPSWALFGGVLVAVVALAFIPFLLSLQRRLALMFVVAGVIYVAGAIIVELLSEELDADSFAYVLAVALEEGLEMLGALLFLYLNLERTQRQQLLRVDVNID